MLKRKREDLSSPQYTNTYLSWLPFEIIEDIVPFFTQNYWQRVVEYEDPTTVKLFTHMVKLDASKTLFYQFRQQYVQATQQTVDALQRCISNFREQYPNACFICRKDAELFEHTEQYHLLHRFPEIMKLKVYARVIYDGIICVPICFECYGCSRSHWRVIWYPGNFDQWRVYLSMQRKHGDPIFAYEVSLNAVKVIDTHGLHVNEFFNASLVEKVRTNNYFGLFPYLTFIFDRDHHFGSIVGDPNA